MAAQALENAPPVFRTPPRTKGETYEGIAFTFCKAATLILLTQKFALPVAAGAAAVFYLLAYRYGARETRCIVRVPLLVSAFWGIVACLSLYLILRPLTGR
jgi:hypothetical protein